MKGGGVGPCGRPRPGEAHASLPQRATAGDHKGPPHPTLPPSPLQIKRASHLVSRLRLMLIRHPQGASHPTQLPLPLQRTNLQKTYLGKPLFLTVQK